MTTQAKHKKKPISEVKEVVALPMEKAEYRQIDVNLIEFSPLNYRKYFSEEVLNAFAEELKLHGIISALTIRPGSKGRFELVAGERRLRAAKIAGLKAVPAAVIDLTDEQVTELQLSENIQRENPHPMHEAEAIGRMQQMGKSLDEISARLGKSKQFIYVRLKLLQLIPDFQEMLLADVVTLHDAVQIATLSEESQTDFYNEQCSEWKKRKNYKLQSLSYYLNQHRYDLKRAPFNTKDKKLLPDVGACTGCASNSASLKSLFPEFAKEAVCSNTGCYRLKCRKHSLLQIMEQVATVKPVAWITNGEMPELLAEIIPLLNLPESLPVYNRNEISLMRTPEQPDPEDYTYDNDQDEPELDTEEFEAAQKSYEEELEWIQSLQDGGKVMVGLLVTGEQCQRVTFLLEKQPVTGSIPNVISAKTVQEAIKAGTATPELLQAEINRLQVREARLQQIDQEKVQLAIYQDFSEKVKSADFNMQVTEADTVVMALLVYRSLDFHSRQSVNEVLQLDAIDDNEGFKGVYDTFKNLNEQQLSFLIRMALCGNSSSKYPSQWEGYFLYQAASEAGLPVATYEAAQASKAAERKERLETRISDIEKRIKKLQSKAA